MIKIKLQRRSIANLSSLECYHRFYFFNDRAKTVWEVREHILIRFNGGWKKLTICTNDKKEQKRFDSNRSVVFLRDNYIKAA